MFEREMKRPFSLLPVLLCCLALWQCSGPSQGVSVEVIAVAPDIEQVEFRLAQILTVKADALAAGVRPGPLVVVYPSEDLLVVEGHWLQGGQERSWGTRIPWHKGESIRLEIGADTEGVRLVRVSG